MNWVDIIVLIVFIKSILEGFRRGFILSAFKMVGIIVALYMGIFYRDGAINFFKTYFALDHFLSGILPAPTINNFDILSVISIQSIIDLVLSALGFFSVFLLVQILFLLPAYFINSLIKISNLTTYNRLLGVLFGFLRTALLFVLLSAVVSPFLLIFPESFLGKGFGGSYILNYINYLDIIDPFVVKFI